MPFCAVDRIAPLAKRTSTAGQLETPRRMMSFQHGTLVAAAHFGAN
jgi:hypothetical protein